MTKPPSIRPLTIRQTTTPTTPRRGIALTKAGFAKAGQQLVSDQQRTKNLEWLHDAKGGLVSFLLDKSGSMAFIKRLVMEGYNDYLTALRNYRRIGYSLYQFDSDSYDAVFEARPVQYVPMLDDKTYHPLGGTPLYDSLVETIHRADELVAEGRIPANRVIITTLTDGEDTTGKSPDEIRNLIADRQRRGYQFQFLGVGINAYALSNLMGIPPEATMSFDAEQATNAFVSSAKRQVQYLQGRAKDASYTKEDRQMAGDKHTPKLLK